MVLELRNVFVEASGRLVVRGVSLRVGSSELQVLMGPNGAGKSSLLSALMGLPGYRVVKGEALLDGQRLNDLPLYERARRGLGLGFQTPPRMKGVTARCILEALEKIYGPWRDLYRYARLLGVEDLLDKPLGSLSGGERKRVELLLVLAQRPRVMLLDEPDSGVDIDSLGFIADVVEESVRRGIGVLLVTHTTHFLEELVGRGIVSRINVMIDGVVRLSGEPRRVLQLLEEKGLRGAAGGA